MAMGFVKPQWPSLSSIIPRGLGIETFYTNTGIHMHSGISLAMRPANGRRRYIVTTSLIG